MSVNPQPYPVNNPESIYWIGTSGRQYEFQLHRIGTVYVPVAGVYIFCRQLNASSFGAVYVGETENFHRRLSEQLRTHHSIDAVVRCGATHISTMRVAGGLTARLVIETDLRKALNPPCNQQ